MDFFIIILMFLVILVPVGLVFGVAFWASKNRKNKQHKILASLPKNTTYTASVRINSESANKEVIKLKAFQYSGILYLIEDGKVYFKGTNGKNLSFDLRNSTLKYEGVHIQNGLLEWFSITDTLQGKYFFNVETGTFIFHTSRNKETTRSIYDRLFSEQEKFL